MNFLEKFKTISLNKSFRQPMLDVVNKEKEIKITAELPGIKKNDLKINIKEDSVELKAEKKMEKEVKKKDYYMCERSYGGFYRKFSLPAKVDPKKAKKEFKEGILKIVLPKKK